MTKFRLVLRTVSYFRLADLAVAAGAAVGTAVLAGSLLVGSSVRQSLVEMAGRRLGEADHVLVVPHFFRSSLAERLERLPGFRPGFRRAVALLAVPASASSPAGGRAAARVTVYGRGDVAPGMCVVSTALAKRLDVRAGDTLVVRADRRMLVPGDVPLGADTDEIALLRLKIARVAEEGGFEGSFSLRVTQRPVRNVWVPLADIARALDAPGRANCLLVSAAPGHEDPGAARTLDGLLREAATLEDYGLKLTPTPDGGQSLESDRLILGEWAEQAAGEAGLPSAKVYAYLADTVKDLRTGRECPYTIVAGMSAPPGGPLGDDEIALSRWAADDLGAREGDRVDLSYHVRAPSGLYETRRAEFALARVVPMSGLGADRTLVPSFKGLTDAETMGSWDAPREMDFRPGRIRDIDEDYWEKHRAAPRAFVGLATAKRLWRTRFGSLSSVRFHGIAANDLRARLAEALRPADAGLVFRAVRHEQLAAAAGSTDFAGLFAGFSMFLVAGAAFLVALLTRLAVEQRSRQIAVMRATGFTEKAVRRLLMAEGLVVLAAGSLAGAALSAGYAWLMMAGLRTLWREAVGTTLLEFHMDLPALAGGTAAGFLVGAFAIRRGVKGVSAMRIAEAVSGKKPGPSGRRGERRRSRIGRVAFVTLLALGASLPLVAGATDAVSVAPAFFAAGVCMLSAFLLVLHAWLKRSGGSAPGKRAGTRGMGLVRLGARNASRNPGRSILTAGLLAAASFTLFAVGAMKGQPVDTGKAGGTGGYSLVAEFDVPIPYDPGTVEGRRLLGLRASDDALWDRVEFAAMRASAGDDASCRNLYRPQNPRVLSVAPGFVADRPFSFHSSLAEGQAPSGARPALTGVGGEASPWELLDSRAPGDPAVAPPRLRGRSRYGAAKARPGAIPCIADFESAQWILKKKLGQTVSVLDERGAERELRIVALLNKSIFQSALLVSERSFRELFPSRSGFGFLLVRASPEDSGPVAAALDNSLADFGAVVEPARERLASFAAIANSYISAFQMLGGLGLLLGSLGLAVVLARAIIERRGEIALMSALGFRKRSVALLLAAENTFLLAAGVAAGALSAAAAVAPELARSGLSLSRGGTGLRGALFTCAVLAGVVIATTLVTMTLGLAALRGVSAAALRRE